MNDKQDYSDIGERIQNAVQDAVESMDFGQINRIVTDTVSGAIDEVRRQVNLSFQQAGKSTQSGCERMNAADKRASAETGVRINRSGKVGGILMVVFGSIGTGIFAILALVNLLVWSLRQTAASAVLVFLMALLCAACGNFIAKGCSIQARIKRAERYAKLGGKTKYLEMSSK